MGRVKRERHDQNFLHTTSFNRQLCGDAWINSKTIKLRIFKGSSGSIARKVCEPTTAPVTRQYTTRRPFPEQLQELEEDGGGYLSNGDDDSDSDFLFGGDGDKKVVKL